MLNAFKIKEFDLRPIYEEWKDGPVFTGNPKDISVEVWLEKIKEGCTQRKVPEEYWYKVAQHFMGPQAKARLNELKQVIVKVHGGKYRWTWKKFTVAMLNMGWSIDKDKKETIKIQRKGTAGTWFLGKKTTVDQGGSRQNTTTEGTSKRPPTPPSRSNSKWFSAKPVMEEPEDEIVSPAVAGAATPSNISIARHKLTRSSTMSSGFWPKRLTKDENPLPERPPNSKAKSDTTVVLATKKDKEHGTVSRSHTEHESNEVTQAQAPAWLINACTALEYITSEHPKAMSIISAILITAGSIPAIPAIAAGAGGAILASGTAQAIGAVAIGLGQALGAGVVKQQKGSDHGSDHDSGSGHGH